MKFIREVTNEKIGDLADLLEQGNYSILCKDGRGFLIEKEEEEEDDTNTAGRQVCE